MDVFRRVSVFLIDPDGSRQCWCFGSNGLQALGQRELVFLLECLPEEKALPKDLFTLYLNIYQEAQKGRRHIQKRLCEFLFTGETNSYRITLFCFREVLGGAG